ncbi:hypothetical protein BGZ73_003342 [Actinomortierella ambigua]|nr:hypothetical protein BGZ73_003342 [Actinomortierella ambigua]
MWNDPSLVEPRSPPRRRTDRERGKVKENKDKDLNELTAFGYECFLFRNDEVVAAIETGQYLIPWQSQDPTQDDTLWLDRYDARNLLDDQRYFTGMRQVHDNTLLGVGRDYDLDQERYENLDSDEEIMFDMDEYEREEHLEEKRSAAYRLDRRGIGFNYDDEAKDVAPFTLHFSVPEGMATPEDAKSLALIERTAKFINSCSEPTMEATLQVKQAGNPSFGFLTRRNPLHAFYKHVKWLMQTGAYEYEEDVKKRQQEEENIIMKDEDTTPSLDTLNNTAGSEPSEEHGPPHQDVQQIVDTTARYVAKCGPRFEDRIRTEKDERFDFLDKAHLWHEYYCRKLAEWKLLQKEQHLTTTDLTKSHNDSEVVQENQSAQESKEDAAESRIDPSALFISYVEQEELTVQLPQQDEADTNTTSEISSSNPNISSTTRMLEMKRLERMQRIRELLQRKQGLLFPGSPNT